MIGNTAMRITEWLGDVREIVGEMKRRGSLRCFLEVSCGMMWAEMKLWLGSGVQFRRSVVEAADACDEAGGPEGASPVAVERFEKCRAAGDRAGMAFWRSVGVYSVLSVLHGAEKIRIVDG